MADAWTVADATLGGILRAYLSSLRPSSWYVLDLYVNDYVPAPGDEAGNYVIPTTSQWPGYVGVQLSALDWSRVQVSESVATTFQPDTAVFTYPSGIASITIYGYVVTNGYGDLIWAERFPMSVLVSFPGGLSIQPYFNIGILPPTDELLARPLAVDPEMAEDDDAED